MTGRPTVRNETLIDQIIERVTNGEPLAQVLRTDGMPCVSAFYNWLNADKELDGRFARAREFGHDAIAVEALRIADTPLEGQTVTSKEWGEEIKTEDMLGHRKLQVETRLKLLAKWDRRYADRTQHEHTGRVTLEALVSGVEAEASE
jgi:hypothetical protein